MKQKTIQYLMQSRTDTGLLILRLGIGLQLFLHGLPKATGGPEKWLKLGKSMEHIGIQFWPEFWGFMAMFAEFGGGFLIMLGLFTRPAAALAAFTMFIAAFHHWSEVWNEVNMSVLKKWMEGSNAIELLVVCLALYFTGPGRISADQKLFRK